MFVGQRKDPFVVNLGEIFDLVNVTNPLGAGRRRATTTRGQERHLAVLEVPIACLTASAAPVIGGWTTASLRSAPATTTDLKEPRSTAMQQVSRLGMPLVNEVVIGLKDKDRFNASEPKDDAQFADLRHQPDAARAARDPVRRRRREGADALPAHRPGRGLPDRRPGPERERLGRRRCCG